MKRRLDKPPQEGVRRLPRLGGFDDVHGRTPWDSEDPDRRERRPRSKEELEKLEVEMNGYFKDDEPEDRERKPKRGRHETRESERDSERPSSASSRHKRAKGEGKGRNSIHRPREPSHGQGRRSQSERDESFGRAVFEDRRPICAGCEAVHVPRRREERCVRIECGAIMCKECFDEHKGLCRRCGLAQDALHERAVLDRPRQAREMLEQEHDDGRVTRPEYDYTDPEEADVGVMAYLNYERRLANAVLDLSERLNYQHGHKGGKGGKGGQ